MTFLRGCMLWLLLFPATLMAQEQPRTILVLDGSGSMWGQIDGVAKITIAQQVVGELLGSLPQDQELGLTAYGHRTKGDCADIETLVTPGAATRDAISAAVNGIKPRGKTPMTDAVVAAAEALRYTEEKATVILVSDGIETCNPDPCAAARALEETGVDFTAHVVGFDVADPEAQKQMQCLAGETGGRFLLAANASELGKALTEVAVAVAPEPQPVTVTFVATEGDGGARINTPLIWTVSKGATSILDFERGALVQADLMPGEFNVSVIRPEDEASAELTFAVTDAAQTVTLVLPPFLPLASLDAVDTAVAGSTIALTWEGPNAKNDYLEVAVPDQRNYENYATTRDGSPVDLLMPPLPGTYELRYILGDGRKVLATRPIEITEAAATLAAPNTAVAGETLDVSWTGPDYKNDYLAVSRIDDQGYENYINTRKGSPGQLLMPPTPGTYELRYVMSQDRTVLATRQIEVVPATATLEAADTAQAGQTLPVTWTGPDYQNDYIAVSRIGDQGHENYAYTRKGSPGGVVMPTAPGSYELRYVMAQDRTVLATRPIEVVAITATLEAPEQAQAGEALAVNWTGPDYQNDYISVARPGDQAYEAYTYTRTGAPLDLTMPLAPGSYELRYVMAQGRTILATKPIEVVEVAASLSLPETARAGAGIVVEWDGPGYPQDYISIARPGDPRYDAYTYTRTGSPLLLRTPSLPGTYEVRYVAASNGTSILARKEITLTEVTAEISAADTGKAGGNIAVVWEGPDYRGDYIAIARANSSDNETVSHANTSEDSPLVMKLPEASGAYELRYYIGQNRRVLARKTLVVE